MVQSYKASGKALGELGDRCMDKPGWPAGRWKACGYVTSVPSKGTALPGGAEAGGFWATDVAGDVGSRSSWAVDGEKQKEWWEGRIRTSRGEQLLQGAAASHQDSAGIRTTLLRPVTSRPWDPYLGWNMALLPVDKLTRATWPLCKSKDS